MPDIIASEHHGYKFRRITCVTRTPFRTLNKRVARGLRIHDGNVRKRDMTPPPAPQRPGKMKRPRRSEMSLSTTGLYSLCENQIC